MLRKSRRNRYSRPEPEKLLAKAELARRISAIIRESDWGLKEAARRLGIDQPNIWNLMRGKLSDISVERLMDYLSQFSGMARRGVPRPQDFVDF